MANTSKSAAGGKIDPIVATPIPQEKAWISVLKAFNPIGPMAESYAKTLAYRIECKRLEAELERVKIQAGIVHDALDKAYILKMEELAQRKVELNRFYDTVQQNLVQLHIERMEVLEMAKMANAKMLDSSISLEDRRFYKELALEFVKQIPLFGNTANDSLDKIVQSLPVVNIPSHMLLQDLGD